MPYLPVRAAQSQPDGSDSYLALLLLISESIIRRPTNSLVVCLSASARKTNTLDLLPSRFICSTWLHSASQPDAEYVHAPGLLGNGPPTLLSVVQPSPTLECIKQPAQKGHLFIASCSTKAYLLLSWLFVTTYLQTFSLLNDSSSALNVVLSYECFRSGPNR